MSIENPGICKDCDTKTKTVSDNSPKFHWNVRQNPLTINYIEEVSPTWD